VVRQKMPEQVTLFPASATLNGEPVEVSIVDNLVTLSLGDLPALATRTFRITAIVR
jgi:hypothetical protein